MISDPLTIHHGWVVKTKKASVKYIPGFIQKRMLDGQGKRYLVLTPTHLLYFNDVENVSRLSDHRNANCVIPLSIIQNIELDRNGRAELKKNSKPPGKDIYQLEQPSRSTEARRESFLVNFQSLISSRSLLFDETDDRNYKKFWVDIGLRQFHFKVADQTFACDWVKLILYAQSVNLRLAAFNHPNLMNEDNVANSFDSQINMASRSSSPQRPAQFSRQPSMLGKQASSGSIGDLHPRFRRTNQRPLAFIKSYESDISSLLEAREMCLILQMERLLLQDPRISKCLSECFFESIQSLPPRIKIERSKQMGAALAIWLSMTSKRKTVSTQGLEMTWGCVLGVDDNSSPDHLLLESSRGGGGKDIASPSDDCDFIENYQHILEHWLLTSMSKELTHSCNLHKNSSKISTSQTDETTPPVPNPTIQESQDSPFRVDNPEILFVSSLIKSSMQYSGGMKFLLEDEIIDVATNPTAYCFNQSLNINSAMNGSLPGASGVGGSAHSNTNNSESSFLSFHSFFQLSRLNSNSHSDNSIGRSRSQDAHEPHVVLTKEEIDEKLSKSCRNIVEKLEIELQSEQIPLSLSVFIRTLKTLVVGEDFTFPGLASSERKSISRTAKHKSTIDNNNNADADIDTGSKMLFDKPDLRVFNLSLTAILFLRLIGPAIISPIEWGVLHRNHTGQLTYPCESNFFGNYDFLSANPWFRQSQLDGSPTAAMLLMAHSFHENKELQKVLGELSPAAGAVMDIMDQLASTVEQAKVLSVIEEIQGSLVNLTHGENDKVYAIANFDSMDIRKPLIEVAKTTQKVANMACMSTGDMEHFLADDKVRQKSTMSPVPPAAPPSDDAPVPSDSGAIKTDELTATANQLNLLFAKLGNSI